MAWAGAVWAGDDQNFLMHCLVSSTWVAVACEFRLTTPRMSLLNFFKSVPRETNLQFTDECFPTTSTKGTNDEQEVSQDLEVVAGASERDCVEPPLKQPRIESSPSSHDLARYTGNRISLSDAERYELLVNPFRSSDHYKFPKSTSGRALSFQHPWLAYSEEKNRGFCTCCVLFATLGWCESDPGILVRHPLISFSKALEVLSKNATKEYHKMALFQADRFMGVMQKQQLNI